MTLIKRIVKIKGYRIFRDFSWPSKGEINPFGRFNLIYGANGSGKTSLSALFDWLERPEAIPKDEYVDADVKFELDDKSKITGKDILDMKFNTPVRVFNKEFVERSIKNIHDVEPIYVVGENNVTLNSQLEEHNQRLKVISGKINDLQEVIQDATDKSDALARNNARNIRTQLSGSILDPYPNYDKRNFHRAIDKMKDRAAETYTLSNADVKKYHSIRRQQSKPYPGKISEAISPYSVAKAYEGILQMLLEIPASSIIDELASNKKVQSWVQEGLSLHFGEHQTGDCHFCGNSISDKRRSDLKKHFSDEVAGFQLTITNIITRINNEKKLLVGGDIPDAHRFHDDLISRADVAITRVKSKRKDVCKLMDNLLQHLKNKKENPFEPITLEGDDGCVRKAESDLQEALESLGEILNMHKEREKNMSAMILDSCQKLEKHYISADLSDFWEYGKLITSNTKDEQECVREQRELKRKINEIQLKMEDCLTPAEELNQDLEEYLGHSEIRFTFSKGGYKITRGNEGGAAYHLSEGEQTAIAFLYFLKSLKNKQTSPENTIVVIDDPISNLDNDALFNAFSYMKKRTEKCLQLFLLTHNLDMFKMVREWFRGKWFNSMEGNSKKYPIYSLHTTISENESRSTSIAPIDPLLNISDYHYSFGRIYQASNQCSQGAAVAHLRSMPNVARRLLETFLEYSFPHINPSGTTGTLKARLDKVDLDDVKKEKVFRALNDLSHARFPPSEFNKSVASLRKIPEIMKSVLDIINAVNPSHYEGMVKVTKKMSRFSKEGGKKDFHE